jgi:hypothetical protein
MRKSFSFTLLLLLSGISAAISLAQAPSSPTPVNHYKADFVVKEVDASGHVVNNRSFSTILATTNEGSPNEIRSGDRIPIRTESGENGGKLAYIDIGVNIDCQHVHEIDQKLAMAIKAELSSIPEGVDLKATLDPLIRQFKWNAEVLIAPGVPTTIFSSDDVSSKTKVQLEVTATLIK